MLKAKVIEKIFISFYKKYRKYIPQFIEHYKYLDPFVLGSFFDIYEQSDSIQKLRPKFFLNTKTGWIYRIIDIRGFRRSKWFYIGYFHNKRVAKRYVFGLLPNKKVVLCAIATHVSADPSDQKHASTRQSLIKAKQIMRPIVLKKLREHQDLFVFDMKRIDSYLFKFIRKNKIRRVKPNWLRIYQIAALSNVYWKGQ